MSSAQQNQAQVSSNTTPDNSVEEMNSEQIQNENTPSDEGEEKNTESSQTTQPTKPSVTVTTAAKQSSQPAKQEVGKMANAAASPDTNTQETELARILEGLADSEKTSIAMILSYIDKMSPGKQINPTEGGQLQVGLYRTLRNIINNETKNFDKLWTAVLKLAEIHRNGCFHYSHAFRFFDSETYILTKNEGSAFSALLILLNATGPAKQRQHQVKTIDFEKTLRYGFTDEGRNRLLSYYKVV